MKREIAEWRVGDMLDLYEDDYYETDESDCCVHGVGWDEDCPDCDDYEDEADGL